MTGECRSARFAQVCEHSAFGPRFAGDLYATDGNVATLRTTDISADGCIEYDTMPLARLDLNQFQQHVLQTGDLVITRSGRIGTAALFNRFRLPVLPGAFLIRFRLKTDVVDPRFYRYFFNSPAGQELLHSVATGSVQQNLNITSVHGLQVPLPPLREQRAIAHILGTLDDKIELNRRMNETLEAMARALFKSWFVDFDPVRAKAEGRDPGLPQSLADVFPDRFEDSELSEIPAGWEVARLGEDLADLVSGARPKGGAVDEGVPSIGAENVIGLGRYDFSKEKFVPLDFFKQLKSKGAGVRPGDVLLYKDGAQIGRKAYFDRGFPHAECAINEHVFILRCTNSWMQRYLFFWLDLPWMTSEIVSLNSNSAQPGINQGGVRQLPLLRPTDQVVQAFDGVIAPMTDALFEGCLESRTLAALRDTLLPKLVSGELRVKDADEFSRRLGFGLSVEEKYSGR